MRPCIFHSLWKQHSPEICLTSKLKSWLGKQINETFLTQVKLRIGTKAEKIVSQQQISDPENLFAFGHRLKKELEKCKDDSWESVCETLQAEIEILQMVCHFHDVF